ncbi:MAG: hypothetical protein WA949_21960, partial [Phormidesmis sp.]
VKEAAATVAESVVRIQDGPDIIYVFAARDFPNFQLLRKYEFLRKHVKAVLENAKGQTKDSNTKTDEKKNPHHKVPYAGAMPKPFAFEAGPAGATTAVVSAGLDAISKILGYFKTDYTVGSTAVQLDESLLLYSVAGKLRENKEVYLPMVYAAQWSEGLEEMVKELADLESLRNQAEVLRKGTDSNSEENNKINRAIGLHDDFVGWLTQPDSNGNVPIHLLVQEKLINAKLVSTKSEGKETDVGVLLLRLENTGGGHLLKNNLWTGLRDEIPLYHMGGATVTYLLLDGKEGKVLDGNVVPVHGGFVRADRMRDELRTTPSLARGH